MSKFRSLFKYKIPKYRIISRTTGGRTRYIIQRREWFGWRAVTNLRSYGVGNPTIEVIAEYDRQIDAYNFAISKKRTPGIDGQE